MELNISDILTPRCIRLDLDVKDKHEALEALVALIGETGVVRDTAELRRVIFEREKLMSTGIGNGVALPHGKTNTVQRSVAALATLRQPIAFDSIDDQPVTIILMLVGTEGNVGMHLRLLSRISRTIGSDAFRTALREARTTDDVMELFASQDEERA